MKNKLDERVIKILGCRECGNGDRCKMVDRCVSRANRIDEEREDGQVGGYWYPVGTIRVVGEKNG